MRSCTREISAKFTPERLQADLEAAGLALERWFIDDAAMFGISVSRPAD